MLWICCNFITFLYHWFWSYFTIYSIWIKWPYWAHRVHRDIRSAYNGHPSMFQGTLIQSLVIFISPNSQMCYLSLLLYVWAHLACTTFKKNLARYGIIYWRYLEANTTLKLLSVRSSVILLQIYVFEPYPYPPLYKYNSG